MVIPNTRMMGAGPSLAPGISGLALPANKNYGSFYAQMGRKLTKPFTVLVLNVIPIQLSQGYGSRQAKNRPQMKK
jgi:hypothetical protein